MVDFDKGAFVGREALVDASRHPPDRKLAGLELDLDEAAQLSSEVTMDEETVGVVTSAVWSLSLKKSIAIAMIRSSAAAVGTRLRVKGYGPASDAVVVPMPFLDPGRKLSKG
jgi:aminomethyltransferase